jgi:hypothetical protein
MVNFRAFRLAGIVALCGVALPSAAIAVNVTPAVQRQCQWDYHNYCSEYGLGSALLTLCFHKNGRKLSRGCVKALIAAGDVSRSYVLSQEKGR